MSPSFRRACWLRPQSFWAMVLIVLILVAGVESWGLELEGLRLQQYLLRLYFC